MTILDLILAFIYFVFVIIIFFVFSFLPIAFSITIAFITAFSLAATLLPMNKGKDRVYNWIIKAIIYQFSTKKFIYNEDFDEEEQEESFKKYGIEFQNDKFNSEIDEESITNKKTRSVRPPKQKEKDNIKTKLEKIETEIIEREQNNGKEK